MFFHSTLIQERTAKFVQNSLKVLKSLEEAYASPSGEWATPRSRNHSTSRHRDIQRLRDVEPGCIVLYLELHGRAIALAGVEPSEILHTLNDDLKTE